MFFYRQEDFLNVLLTRLYPKLITQFFYPAKTLAFWQIPFPRHRLSMKLKESNFCLTKVLAEVIV